MGMAITGIPCVQWDFYGNGNGNVDRNGVGMNAIEIILALLQWHSHCHRFISNFTHCQLLTAFCFCTAMLSSLSNTPCDFHLLIVVYKCCEVDAHLVSIEGELVLDDVHCRWESEEDMAIVIQHLTT